MLNDVECLKSNDLKRYILLFKKKCNTIKEMLNKNERPGKQIERKNMLKNNIINKI